jgi:hypothetical protein
LSSDQECIHGRRIVPDEPCRQCEQEIYGRLDVEKFARSKREREAGEIYELPAEPQKGEPRCQWCCMPILGTRQACPNIVSGGWCVVAEGEAVQEEAMQPTYFVKHPDESFSVAEPQPSALREAAPPTPTIKSGLLWVNWQAAFAPRSKPNEEALMSPEEFVSKCASASGAVDQIDLDVYNLVCGTEEYMDRRERLVRVIGAYARAALAHRGRK